MPGQSAVIDTSVLLSLQCTGTLGAVSVLFERILVPGAVRGDLERGGVRSGPVLRALEEFAFFERCDETDRERVRLLLDTRAHQRAGRDEGEAEAVIQATLRDVDIVLIDDALGREWAETHTRVPHGTLWVLDQLRTNGFLAELRPLFLRLIADKRRQPLDVMNQFLRKHREQIIAPADPSM